MQYTVPHYYKKFTCLSGDCPDTCCAGWQIQIDPVSLKKYRKTEGPLGARLHNEIDWEESCFRQYNGRCAFLNEENLCDLYTEGGGEKAFCRTCRTYPRHIEEFEGLREISLSLSCPAAARLILECQEPVRFLHKKNDKEENEPDYDPTPVESIELSLTLPTGAETTGRIASHSDEIWAYWHITSGTGLSIDIKGAGVMEMTGAGETNDDIDWNIALDSAQTGTDQATSQNVYTHKPTETGVGADGSRKITLTTEDLTGLALAPGEYTANLVLSITQS